MRNFIILFILLVNAISLMAQNPSGTLPVLYINTENNAPVVDKENYLTASYWLDPAATDVTALGSQDSPLPVEIRGRGNYTWIGFDKKPYKLKFGKKTSVLGMKENKHYALLAHADDRMGFLRNTVGFKLSEDLGMAWTPGAKPLEVVLNGDYLGLYFLTETIRVDKNRVNIFEMADEAVDDVTGGWLVEIDNYDKDPHVSITEGNGEKIVFTYKTPEILSEPQRNYLLNQVTNLDNLIYGDKNSDAIWDVLDIESAAKFYIVQEILDDCESYHGSCYLYKDRGDDSKWHFGPVWDFGNSFLRGYKNRFIFTEPSFNQTWIGEIYKFPKFQQKVKEIWKDFCDNECAGLTDYIQSFISEIETASVSSYERWPQYGNKNVRSKMEEMVKYLSKSLEWLGNQWGYAAPDINLPPQIYVRGEFNGWNTDSPMSHRQDGSWILSGFSVAHDSELKIADADWAMVNYGALTTGEELIPEQEFQLAKVGHNIEVKACEGMTLIFNPEKETLLLTAHSGVETPSVVDKDEEISEIYTLGGLKVRDMNMPGIYLVRKGDKMVKVLKR